MKKKYHLHQCTKFDHLLLSRHLQHHAHRIVLWQKGMKDEEMEHYKVIKSSSETNLFTLQKIGNILKKAVKSKIKDGHTFFKISIGRKTYCGKAEFNYLEHTSYSFKVSKKLFIFDQRSNYRLASSESISIRAKYNNKKFDGLNVSGSSLCLKIAQSDISLFPPGQVLKEIKFVINENMFKISQFRTISIREIRNAKNETTDYYQVVIMFYRSPKTYQQTITKLIDHHARQILLSDN
jgi:hypothetical protein